MSATTLAPDAAAAAASGTQTMGTKPGGADAAPYHHEGGNMPPHTHHDEEVTTEATVQSYWQSNIRLLLSLLAIWFVVSFGAGILFVEPLNNFQLGGYPLGFWFAQQGSIYVFVALIFFYSYRMKRIERQFGVDDDE